MAEDDREDLRVRLRPGLKERLEKAMEAKQTTQTKLVNQLVAWFLEQDGLLQSVILGQVEPTEDLVELIPAPPAPAEAGSRGGLTVLARIDRSGADFYLNYLWWSRT
jgi:hypothetical protein